MKGWCGEETRESESGVLGFVWFEETIIAEKMLSLSADFLG